MVSLQDSRKLVCSFCLQNLFETEQFKLLCLCQCAGAYCENGISYKITVRQINESASNSCNWCSYIWTFTSRKEDTRDPDDVLSIYLCDFYPDYSTPAGKNAYYLAMNRESQKLARDIGWSLRLHAYTRSTDVAAPFVTARKLQTELNSDASRLQIQHWLAECADHNECPGQPETVLPTRVVEVAPVHFPDKPRILVTAGKKGCYAALSYCWGSNAYGELKQSNLNEYTQHLCLDALPQTLYEAIALCKSISVPYLWVDALCIIQDSKDDKSHEISMMKQVYRDSLVTIVAANSEDVTHGFLQTRKAPLECFTVPFRLSESQFGTISVQELDAMEYDESLEPINKRAWTLQESLLAHRYLIYSSHSLQWRCNAGVRNLGNALHLVSYADTNPYSQSLYTLNTPASDPDGELRRWIRLVHVYSTRSASLSHDKLNAISAIAQKFSPSLGPQYFAGVWEFAILWQLTWVTSCSWDSKAMNIRPQAYRAPSWSWASIDGALSYDSSLLETDREGCLYRCEYISCQVELKSADFSFGEVLAGSLTLKGVLRRAWFMPSAKKIRWLCEENEALRTEEFTNLAECAEGSSKQAEDNERPDGDTEIKASHDEGGDWPSMLVFCFPISVCEETVSMGLLLATFEDAFKRVGSFENAQRGDFDPLPQRWITIR